MFKVAPKQKAAEQDQTVAEVEDEDEEEREHEEDQDETEITDETPNSAGVAVGAAIEEPDGRETPIKPAILPRKYDIFRFKKGN